MCLSTGKRKNSSDPSRPHRPKEKKKKKKKGTVVTDAAGRKGRATSDLESWRNKKGERKKKEGPAGP